MKMVNYGLNSDCEGSFTLSKKCRTSSKPSVMVWGDSHAMHLVQAITSSKSFEDESMIQFTKSVCSPILQVSLTNRNYTENWAKGCIQFNEKVSDWLSKNKSVQYVIMSSPLYITNSTIYDSNGASHNPSQELVLEKMNKTAKFIKSLGKKPVFISSPPRTGEDLSKCAVHELIFSDAKKATVALA